MTDLHGVLDLVQTAWHDAGLGRGVSRGAAQHSAAAGAPSGEKIVVRVS